MKTYLPNKSLDEPHTHTHTHFLSYAYFVSN